MLEVAGVILVLSLFAVAAGKYFYGPVVRASFERAGNVAGAHLRYLAYRMAEPAVYTRPPTEPAQSLPVLLYHGIRTTPYKEDMLLSTFEDHLLTLKEAGYQTISIAQFEAFLAGKTTLPARSFLLTFDDGIKSSYYMADPLLKAIDYSAVMFIITKYSLAVGSSYYLSLDEVRAMLDSGRWEIESHGRDAHALIVIDAEGTKGHFLTNKMWLEAQGRLEIDTEYRTRIAAELTASKRDIQETLGFEPIAFAFPFGDFGQTSHNFPDAQQVLLESISPIYSLANFYQSWPSRGFPKTIPTTDRS